MGGDGNSHYMACNYGPSGNVVGGALFKRGKPCTFCPAGPGKKPCTKNCPCNNGLCMARGAKYGN